MPPPREISDLEELWTEIICCEEPPASLQGKYEINLDALRAFCRNDISLEKVVIFFVCQHEAQFLEEDVGNNYQGVATIAAAEKPALFRPEWVAVLEILRDRLLRDAGVNVAQSLLAAVGGGGAQDAGATGTSGGNLNNDAEDADSSGENLAALYLTFQEYMHTIIKVYLPSYRCRIREIMRLARQHCSKTLVNDDGVLDAAFQHLQTTEILSTLRHTHHSRGLVVDAVLKAATGFGADSSAAPSKEVLASAGFSPAVVTELRLFFEVWDEDTSGAQKVVPDNLRRLLQVQPGAEQEKVSAAYQGVEDLFGPVGNAATATAARETAANELDLLFGSGTGAGSGPSDAAAAVDDLLSLMGDRSPQQATRAGTVAPPPQSQETAAVWGGEHAAEDAAEKNQIPQSYAEWRALSEELKGNKEAPLPAIARMQLLPVTHPVPQEKRLAAVAKALKTCRDQKTPIRVGHRFLATKEVLAGESFATKAVEFAAVKLELAGGSAGPSGALTAETEFFVTGHPQISGADGAHGDCCDGGSWGRCRYVARGTAEHGNRIDQWPIGARSGGAGGVLGTLFSGLPVGVPTAGLNLVGGGGRGTGTSGNGNPGGKSSAGKYAKRAPDLGVFDGEEEAGVVFAGRNCVSHADQADHTVQLHALKKLLENEVAQAAAAPLPENVDTGGDAGESPTLPLLAVILQKDLSLLWHKGRERGAGENFVFSNRLMRGVARLRHVLPRLARYVLLTWERKSAESATLGFEVRAREDTIVRELENRVRFFVRTALYAYDFRAGKWVLRTDAPSPKQWLLAISKNKHDLTLAVTQRRSEKEKSWLREVELNGDRHLLSALEWVFVSALALAWEELQQELCAILVATSKGAAHTEPMPCESGGVWDNYVERELWTYSLAEALAANAAVKLDGQECNFARERPGGRGRGGMGATATRTRRQIGRPLRHCYARGEVSCQQRFPPCGCAWV
eukprot:g7946.t1